MKTKKISLKEIQDALSRAEMKKIMAGSGDNPNCGDEPDYDDWYCCTGEVEHLGYMECNAASDRCASDGGSGITNEPSRCYY